MGRAHTSQSVMLTVDLLSGRAYAAGTWTLYVGQPALQSHIPCPIALVAATPPRRYQRCYSKCFDPSGNKAKHPLGRPPADAMPTHKELEEFEDAHCRRGRAARVEEYE